MTPGIAARLDRVGTDGRYVVVPMDHGITLGAVNGLKDIESTIDAVTRGGADSVLTQKGIADRVHGNKNGAGYIVHLNGSTAIGPDSNDKRATGSVEAALRAGADAVSFHINVGSKYEREQIEALGRLTDQAAEYGLPVLAMTYARGPDIEGDDPEALGHAVRLGEELGADLIKTGYSGDAESFEHVCESTSLPVLIAGGSPDGDLESLRDVRGAMDAGAAGVSMGRTIFQHESPEHIARAVSLVVHDDYSAEAALEAAELSK
ncbi:2-amino-3,7-dideoxy-D-threo-hept-6-ulosonate synthase [Natronomonas pharaonis DSM 2160]|uniref:2-amino-3,7-dideoxy-D-threo-hept-6-ulosonate synthase n=1 Tax=Natronomonas pharaonis (strain ATCC 35678 / DSM 2160 / CIP 103997 / JCM 8858 / NBRC 14720 / NCIMB 2260 / Gabara) TaxID=348780 RepID=A0A1U7EX33_NATPD|nr:2-amino-3,7-dideoxy-D-threo-hept-6-ulosonate synthase [Natronomonas pharaonis]CAI49671.1 2-amino-3,7-dideoxy-D-threo-hept-6-ulosonate synthase [Natronomonas pharaonis DSM 2160]